MHTLIEFAVKEQENLNETVRNTFRKLGCMVDNIPELITRIEGKVSEFEIAITIMTDEDHVTMAGKFDGTNDTFPVQIWKNNIPAGTMNWDPLHGHDDLDFVNFENDFTEIYNS